MKKYFTFWKSSWGNHYFFWIIIYLIFVVFITVTQIPSANVFLRGFFIMVLIFFLFFGHIFAMFSFDMAKRLFSNILNLNNHNYWEKTSKRKIPYLLIILPVYLIIFQTYFTIANYNFIEALVFGWMILIFVRSSHYIDSVLGAKIGEIIGSFFIPFGFIVLLTNAAKLYINLSLGKININEYFSYFLYFIMFLIAIIPLEILLDYKRINVEEKKKKTEWKNAPCFIKYKKK